MSASLSPVSMVRTPQEMSKPTPPAARRDAAIRIRIESGNSADRKAIAPMRVGHDIGCGNDTGKGRDICRLVVNLVVHAADEVFIRVDDRGHAHGAAALDAPS